MPVASFQASEIGPALDAVGIGSGDCVLMHSSLIHLGRMEGCASADVADRIIGILLRKLGPTGTLVVPAAFYDYSNDGVPFDTRRSPVSRELGVLSAALAARDDAERSANPMFSLAAVGRHARTICNGPNASAFGAESAWDRLVGLNARILLLGSDIDRLTLIRYIEQRAAVPYLYVKMFRTPIFREGQPLDMKVTALLRYRHLPIAYSLTRYDRRLRDQGLLEEAALGGGFIRAAAAADCVRAGIDALQEDGHYFLADEPAYIDTDIPLV